MARLIPIFLLLLIPKELLSQPNIDLNTVADILIVQSVEAINSNTCQGFEYAEHFILSYYSLKRKNSLVSKLPTEIVNFIKNSSLDLKLNNCRSIEFNLSMNQYRDSGTFRSFKTVPYDLLVNLDKPTDEIDKFINNLSPEDKASITKWIKENTNLTNQLSKQLSSDLINNLETESIIKLDLPENLNLNSLNDIIKSNDSCCHK